MKTLFKSRVKSSERGEAKGLVIGIVAFVAVILLLVGVKLGTGGGGSGDGKGTGWFVGPESARAQLVEYADFQCPSCGAYFPLLKQLEMAYPEDLRVQFKHFPLVSIHPNAMNAARAAEAAGRQGKFWEMHDRIFESQQNWSNSTNARGSFEVYARDIGLDMDRYGADFKDAAATSAINADRSDGSALGVRGTPTFFLNGQKVEIKSKTMAEALEEFKGLIEAAIASAPLPDQNATSTPVAYHGHVDFALYLEGKKFDLSADKYQSTHEKELSPDVHLHDNNGDIIHLHKEGVTMEDFFESIGFRIIEGEQDLCLSIPGYSCDEPGKRLKLVVNGKDLQNNDNLSFINYKLKDLDRVLVSYGTATNSALQNQIDSDKLVKDEACIYSETCPERGAPPTEECVGGLGTTCIE
jgi:protein-disulfide isomerase